MNEKIETIKNKLRQHLDSSPVGELKTFRKIFEIKKQDVENLRDPKMSEALAMRLDWLAAAEAVLTERGGFAPEFAPRKCSRCKQYTNELMNSESGAICPNCY